MISSWTGKSLLVLVATAGICAGLTASVSLIALGSSLRRTFTSSCWDLLISPGAWVVALPIACGCGFVWLVVAGATLEPTGRRSILAVAVGTTVLTAALLTVQLGLLVAPVALLAGCLTMVIGGRVSRRRAASSA